MSAAQNCLFPWQMPSWEQLTRWIDTQRLPHALIFSGTSGIGRSNLALCFAQSLLCESTQANYAACGECKSCRLFQAQNHPDFMLIEPEHSGKPITIDSIRELRRNLVLSPQYDRYQVVIIRPAGKMNKNATNALLKTLEEPTPQVVLILISETVGELPVTIISRCQQLTIARPDPALATQWLSQFVESAQSEILLSLVNGAPLVALALHESKALEQRKLIFRAWLDVAECHADPVEIAEKWVDLASQTTLFWITGWIIDIIRLHSYPKTQSLNNADFREGLQALAQRLNLTHLFAFFDLLLESRKLVDSQINQQLMWEEILIEWQSITKAC